VSNAAIATRKGIPGIGGQSARECLIGSDELGFEARRFLRFRPIDIGRDGGGVSVDVTEAILVEPARCLGRGAE